MIKSIVETFVTAIKATNSPESEISDRESALRFATAVLMVKVARADHVFDRSEFERLLELITSHFELSPEDSAALVDRATQAAEDVAHMHDLTQILHKHLTESEKEQIVGLLWEVAYADGRLDKYEDSDASCDLNTTPKATPGNGGIRYDIHKICTYCIADVRPLTSFRGHDFAITQLFQTYQAVSFRHPSRSG